MAVQENPVVPGSADRLVIGPSMRYLDRGRWVDTDTGEMVTQLLDRELSTSQAPIIRKLTFSGGRISVKVGGLSNPDGGASQLGAEAAVAAEQIRRHIADLSAFLDSDDDTRTETQTINGKRRDITTDKATSLHQLIDAKARREELDTMLATAAENRNNPPPELDPADLIYASANAFGRSLSERSTEALARKMQRYSVITEFSDRSRRRLVNAMADADWAGAAAELAEATGVMPWMMFLTFSLPNHWRRYAATPEQWNNLRTKLYKRLRRKVAKEFGLDVLPNVPLFWKKEHQGRGAPHDHAVILAPPRFKTESFITWLRKEWYALVDSGDPNHLQHGVYVDAQMGLSASSSRSVGSYLAGYLGPDKALSDKEYQHDAPAGWRSQTGSVGRWWGTRGIGRLSAETRITEHQFVQIKRYLRKALRAKTKMRQLADGTEVEVLGYVPRSLRSTASCSGFSALVDDAPSVMVGLARALALHEGAQRELIPVRERAPRPPGLRRSIP